MFQIINNAGHPTGQSSDNEATAWKIADAMARRYGASHGFTVEHSPHPDTWNAGPDPTYGHGWGPCPDR